MKKRKKIVLCSCVFKWALWAKLPISIKTTFSQFFLTNSGNIIVPFYLSSMDITLHYKTLHKKEKYVQKSINKNEQKFPWRWIFPFSYCFEWEKFLVTYCENVCRGKFVCKFSCFVLNIFFILFKELWCFQLQPVAVGYMTLETMQTSLEKHLFGS